MREICLATIDENALQLANQYDLGLELDQFCTAYYMDAPLFEEQDRQVQTMLSRAKVFHGPFSELAPCAIDPKVRQISMERYNQAYELARSYGISKIVFHGGFIPLVYFPVWYIERSVEFWKEFLADKPNDFVICLENVMETQPSFLVDIVKGVDDPCCRLCLDVGHANVDIVGKVAIEDWIGAFAPYLAHVHLHNNDGSWDWHKNIGEGTLPMERIFDLLDELAPDASLTFENIDDTEQSILWYEKRKCKLR